MLFPVSVVVLSCFADSTDTLLGQILEEQGASLADALKSDYAYTMTHKGFETSGNGARSTISAKFSVVRQGDNLRVTKEHYPVIVLPEAKGGWYQELRMERLVSNRELTAVWSNVAVPEIYLYYSSDWAAPGQSKRHDLTVGVINPVATAFSVETDDGTLIDMIERERRLPIERRPR